MRFAGTGAPARRALQPGEDGTLVAAVIYDPLRDELFTAERGRGTRLNGKPVRVSRNAGCWPRRCWPRAFPAASATPAPIFTFTRSSRCARTACGGPDRPRSTWPTWPAAAWTLSGSSTSIPGTRPPEFCWWKRPAGRVTDFAGAHLPAGQRRNPGLQRLIHEELIGLLRRHVCGAQPYAHPHARGVHENGSEGQGKGTKKDESNRANRGLHVDSFSAAGLL